MKHNFKVGDILASKWGYGQTNVDFYQVVATTEKMVTIRELNAELTSYNRYRMEGYTKPIKNDFTDDKLISKKVFLNNNAEPFINLDKHSTARLWNGEQMYFSTWA